MNFWQKETEMFAFLSAHELLDIAKIKKTHEPAEKLASWAFYLLKF